MSHIPALWRYVVHTIEDHSSLRFNEMVALIATYNHILNDTPDIDPKLAERGYSPAAIALATKKAESKFNPIETLGLRFTRPLSNFKSDVLSYALVLLENYERGVLPFPGSVSEQPAKVMDVFSVLQSLRAERDTQLRKKITKDVGNKHKGVPRASR